MRVLIYPHLMEIGGSQLNAIELANGLARTEGLEVTLFAPPGDLMARVSHYGLDCIESPVGGSWPSPRNIALLNKIVDRRGIDVVHGFEWGPSVELAFGPHRKFRTPMVTTVLSMSVPHLLPTHETMIVGTAELQRMQEGLRPRTFLMEPPIDTELNRSDRGRDLARKELGLPPDGLIVSVICRLTSDLDKSEGVRQAIEVVSRLCGEQAITLLVVGDGPELGDIRQAAAAANARAGVEAVVVIGGLLDPRPAYDAADIVIGMGSSALKGMSFGKPLVVQGEDGFWQLLEPASLSGFLDEGFFGHGGAGEADLERALRRLAVDENLRADLGTLGRDLVVSRYSLKSAVRMQRDIYAEAVSRRPSGREQSAALRRTAVELAKFKALTTARAVRSSGTALLGRSRSRIETTS